MCVCVYVLSPKYLMYWVGTKVSLPFSRVGAKTRDFISYLTAIDVIYAYSKKSYFNASFYMIRICN